MKIGQEIYLEPLCNAARRSRKIQKHTISKIGRKYFEVKELHGSRFLIDTMKHDGRGYTSQYNCYLTLSEVEDKRECMRLHNDLRNHFSEYTNNTPLETLREISKLLNLNPPI